MRHSMPNIKEEEKKIKGGENNIKAKGKNARTPPPKRKNKQNKEHSHGMDVKWCPGYWRNTVIIVSAVVSAVPLQLFNTKRSGTVCSQSSTHNTFNPALSFAAWIITRQQHCSSMVGNWRLTSHPYVCVAQYNLLSYLYNDWAGCVLCVACSLGCDRTSVHHHFALKVSAIVCM